MRRVTQKPRFMLDTTTNRCSALQSPLASASMRTGWLFSSTCMTGGMMMRSSSVALAFPALVSTLSPMLVDGASTRTPAAKAGKRGCFAALMSHYRPLPPELESPFRVGHRRR